MPIYEYSCLDCGEHFETMRPMKDADAPIACIKCESEQTSRLLSVFFAKSNGRAVAGGSSACVSCSSSSCANCGR